MGQGKTEVYSCAKAVFDFTSFEAISENIRIKYFEIPESFSQSNKMRLL